MSAQGEHIGSPLPPVQFERLLVYIIVACHGSVPVGALDLVVVVALRPLAEVLAR